MDLFIEWWTRDPPRPRRGDQVDGRDRPGSMTAATPFDASVHKALASPVRTRIMVLMRASDAGLEVADLADTLDLHPNTVRTHLSVLEEAGLVASRPQPRDRPGRPRLAYEVTRRDRDLAGEESYRFLARVLAGSLASSGGDAAAAISVQAGTAWGRWLAEAPPPATELSSRDALDRLVTMLDDLGFAPEVDDQDPDEPRLLLRRCPFLAVAREQQEVVCSIHLGLMRGALDELGVDVVVEDLQPLVEPDLCIGHVRMAA